ncbi:MAG TPA: protease, partial [Halieaceae bacterium]|nr:protease [Halieaceae bacterium]
MLSWLRVAAWPVAAGVLAALLVLEHWVLPPREADGGAGEAQSYAAAVQAA